MFAEVAQDTHKAIFELCMAWLTSFVFAFFYPLIIDWEAFENRAMLMGGKAKTGIKLFLASLLLFCVLLYPHTPSATGKYGSTLVALLESDRAYVWGLGIILVSSIGWFGAIAGTYLLYRDITTKNNS